MDNNQFYDLATKVLTGEASAQEANLLQTYLEQPEYKKLYDWLEKQWSQDLTHSSSSEFDYNRGLEILRRKINQQNLIRKNKKRQLQIAVSIAASFLLLVGIGSFWLQWKKTDASTQYLSYCTHKGERKTVQLPDGTRVHLNGASSVRFPERFASQERDVEMNGEAFFEVTKNPKQPFVIHTGDFTTTVLGTTFNVEYTDQKSVAVTVETGKVRVENLPKKEGVLLTRGQRAIYDGGKFTKILVDPSIYTEWLDNTLRFDNITTKDAFRKMEKWYNVRIECESPSILNRKIQAVYKNESLKDVVNDLQFIIGFNYNYQNDSVIIVK